MGIHELGIRKDILRCVEAYKQEQIKLGEMVCSDYSVMITKFCSLVCMVEQLELII
jgi:hypothetical protein